MLSFSLWRLAQRWVLILLQGRVGFSLWDEGYLWYGVQRVMAGEVPGRDFLAYDPGRYYWSAGVMSLFGDSGIVSLRNSVALFECFGIALALALVAHNREKSDYSLLSLFAIALLVWMFPNHKLFDITVSIILLAALASVVHHQSTQRYFALGLIVGLAALFGRNHGVYGASASVGVMIYIALIGREIKLSKTFGWWCIGVCRRGICRFCWL